MTIRAASVNVHTHPGNIHGQITLHDDLTDRDVRLRVHPTAKLPGYVIQVEAGQDIHADWPVFVVEADRIIRTLLLTAEEAARREAAVRGVITSNRLEGFDDDPDMEVVLWRFARGELDIDELQAAIETLNDADRVLPESEPPSKGATS